MISCCAIWIGDMKCITGLCVAKYKLNIYITIQLGIIDKPVIVCIFNDNNRNIGNRDTNSCYVVQHGTITVS